MSPIKASGNSLPVLISGYYGFDNLGDEAILESIINWFGIRDDAHPVILSRKPKVTAEMFEVDSISRNNFFKILGLLIRSPVLLQGGGGLLQDATSTRSLLYYLGIMLMGAVTGRRMVAFAQGIGPLDGEFSPMFVGEFLSQCDLVAVRDFKSFAFCQQRLPFDANLKMMADAALLLDPADPERVDDIYHLENLDLLGRPLVGFSIKGNKSDKRQLTALARTINMTMDELGCGVAIFPFHHPYDLKYAEEVFKLVDRHDEVMIVKEIYKPSEAMGLIGKCDMMIGMRLHSLIFAANMSVPFVGVSYDPKIDEFLNEFNLKPAVHTPLLGPEVLFDAIMDTWEDRGRLKTKITEGTSRLRARTKDGFDALSELFEKLELRRVAVKRKVKKSSTAKKD